ncbi:MAG: glycosyltransferase family 2 protein [Pseudomonadota bacterium]
MPQPVETDPAKLRWGIVSTVKAPVDQIARFLAHHLDLGAHRILVHLDVPDAQIAQTLAHKRVQFVQCDAAYWDGRPDRTTATHQMRQLFNASRVYRATRLHWLAHVDVDEYLLPPAPIPELLAAAPSEATHIEVSPVEMMACTGDPHHFKRFTKKPLRRIIFPEFGEYAPGGFIGTESPKCIARTGLDGVKLGIHALRYQGDKLDTGVEMPGLELGHAHAPDYDTFRRHIAYRLDKGSYHDRQGKPNKMGHLIRMLMAEGEDALRAFYDELNAPTPERLDLLRAHEKLRTETLDLEAKVARHFGDLGRHT